MKKKYEVVYTLEEDGVMHPRRVLKLKNQDESGAKVDKTK